MSKEEKVNGPKTVADILKRMPTTSRKKLLHNMSQKDPSISKAVEENLFSFEDIVKLTPKSIQILVASIDNEDLLYSLRTASPDVQETIFNNTSTRRRSILKEELNSLPLIPAKKSLDAQVRIVKMIDELRIQGVIQSEDSDDLWV